MKPFLLIVFVIAGSIVGTYYRQMDKHGKDYNRVGPMIFAAVSIAFVIWMYKSPP